MTTGNKTGLIGASDILTILRTIGNALTTAYNNIANLVTGAYGSTGAYDITGATVVKASPGRIIKVLVNVVGTGGQLTLNDCTTTGAAAAANQIISIPYNNASYVAGAIISLNWPCGAGITVSSVPTGGGVVSIAYA